jgi:peptidoglycan/xylan/chitin deacetylase (PgdA/CDA1 family)
MATEKQVSRRRFLAMVGQWVGTSVLAGVGLGRNLQAGQLIFLLSDTCDSDYTMASPRLRSRGWPAVSLINPSMVDAEDKLTEAMVERLNGWGWDISSHGWTHDNPTQMSPEELDDHLRLSHEWIESRSLDGAAHYGPPFTCNQVVRDAALAYYATVVTAGLGPWAVLPSGYDYAWQPGHDQVPWQTLRAALDGLAGHPGAVLLLSFHRLVKTSPVGTQTSVARFQMVVNRAEQLGVNVTTLTGLS